ncbi:MAG: NAD-dependent epimerase/dehydratase family protein [Planctomycetota bacterium]
MRVLVTGGAGFLGSNLVECLLAAGLEVDVLDDLSQGHLDNLGKALKSRRFTFHLGSVLDAELVGSLVQGADQVYHLAALVGMPVIIQAGAETLRVNASGAYTVLKACARHQTRCILFSSSEVYGSCHGAPLSETDPLNPGEKGSARWLYAVAKICSEKAALHHFHHRNLPVTVVRPFNAIGPRQSEASGMVIPTFIRAALEGRPLQIYGTGEQSRTFVAERDLISQVISLAMDERTLGMVINVGGEEAFSVLALARLVNKVLGTDSPIERMPYRKVYGGGYTDIQHRRPDLSLLKKMGHYHRFQPIRDVIAEIAADLHPVLEKGTI